MPFVGHFAASKSRSKRMVEGNYWQLLAVRQCRGRNPDIDGDIRAQRARSGSRVSGFGCRVRYPGVEGEIRMDDEERNGIGRKKRERKVD